MTSQANWLFASQLSIVVGRFSPRRSAEPCSLVVRFRSRPITTLKEPQQDSSVELASASTEIEAANQMWFRLSRWTAICWRGMGYYETWRLVPGTLPYAFRELSLTLHIGQQGDPVKPQVFRSEWAGVSDWGSGEIGFQAAGAGHPHWQLDALESLAAFAETPQFDPDVDDEVTTFEGAAPAPTELLRSVTVERIHFASAADWWVPVPKGGLARHLNAPNDLDDLTLWATSCIEYLQQELRRCERR